MVVILLEFDITFVPMKDVKGQALADFLAAHPIPDDSLLNIELSDEHILFIWDGELYWKLYFDEASSIRSVSDLNNSQVTAEVGLVFVTLAGAILSHLLTLSEPKTNNEVEYCIP